MRYIKHILGCCLWLPVVVHAGSCEDWVAKAVSIQGTVEVRRAATPSSQWLVIHPDDTFCASDRVRVGPNSRAALLLSNDTILRLDQKTTLNFGQIAADKPSSMSLISGIAHFISRIRQTFTVDTPYVNAGIDGTEFVVAVLKDQARVTVFEGQVKAYNAQGETILTSGQSAVAQRGQAPLLKLLAQPRDAVQWALYYPMIVSADGVSMHSAAEAYRGSIEASLQSYRQGRLAAALQHLSNLPDKLDDAALAVYRAALRLNVGQVSAAQADLARAEQLDPQSAEVAATQSIIAVVQNDRDGALRLAQTALKRDPDNASAHLALSYALQARFDIEGAVATMKKAVARQPGNALARARLAELYLMTGELDKALNNAQAATAIDPQLARTQSVLGFAYLTQIEVEKAQKAFKAAIERDQSDPLARLGLGLAMIRQGELEAGRREIEYAASLDPNNSLIRSYLGKAYYDEKRDKVAASQYDMAKQLDPNDPTPWFYDAIRKQTTNRPVEALKDLQKSIDLNNNRQVFRSRLLLDQDLAARSASLGRIYRDLGFGEMALVEGWKSVQSDPTDFSGHRFLADVYSSRRRHEIARASELLQSQLLQPINVNPLQPQLSQTNIPIVDGAGQSDVGFNEFNPLFTRDRFTFQGSGIAGSNETRGAELVQSGLKRKFSYSLSGLHFETDGFRENNDYEQDLYDVFAQWSLSATTSLQAEYRREETDNGDVTLRFDPDNFLDDSERDINTDIYRLGFHHAFSPRTDLIASAIYYDRNDDQEIIESLPPFDTVNSIEEHGDGYNLEAQYLYRGTHTDLIAGGAYFDQDLNTTQFFDVTQAGSPIFSEFSKEDTDFKQTTLYTYGGVRYPKNVNWTVGISSDLIDKKDDGDDFDETKLNPKFGALWSPRDATTVRVAAFKMQRRLTLVDQTIEPTQVAGFNQFFDDPPGSDVERYAAALDQKVSSSVFAGIEISKRDLDVPITIETPSTTLDIEENQDELLHRTYLYWTPDKRVALRAEYEFEKLKRDALPGFANSIRPKEIRTNRLPLGVNYYHPNGLFSEVLTTYYKQDVEFPTLTGNNHDDDSFWLVDFSAGYRLPKRYGLVSFVVKNVFDENFSFQDTLLSGEAIKPSVPTIQPERAVYWRFTLSY